MLKNVNNRTVLYILLFAGLIVRVLFYKFGAAVYYGTKDFSIQGDTWGWIQSIQNLIDHGLYTENMDVENSKFFRPPGYSFIIGIMYFIAGKDMDNALQILVWVQILLDVVSVYLFYKISSIISRNNSFGLLCAALFAFYPFVIIWTPVLYAETTSVFFMLWSFYFFVNDKINKHYVWSGICIGIAALIRLQCIFAFPAMLAGIYFYDKKEIKLFFKDALAFGLSFALVYGMWPGRNYFLQNRICFSQDPNIGHNGSPDYLSFMDYIFSVKTDHRPQYDQIVRGQPVQWTKESYLFPGDSVKLYNITQLCYTCGKGFSRFIFHEGIKEKPIEEGESNCDSVIEKGFKELIDQQKKHNKFNYWIKVPLSNLKKTLFKFSLYGNKSAMVKITGSTLFVFRSLMIFLGLFGIYLNRKKQFLNHPFALMILGYFLFWYIYLSTFYRNMEIRYLLQTDLLLLIPAAYALWVIKDKMFKSKTVHE